MNTHEPLSIAEVLDLLRRLDDTSVVSGKTTLFLETRKDQHGLCINGNREGLVHFARCILEVAQKGSHQHFDEVVLDFCETPLIICLKPAEWEAQEEQT